MTLDQARDAIGRGVVYAPRFGLREDGVIIRVNNRYVFVRYSGSLHAQATNPTDLELRGGV
jgi:hypothetical protein